MECKNCSGKLRTDYSYCPDCGAKVIRNRITVKNLWFDIVERVFNLDNTFIRTVVHLFSKPDKVIHGYVTGQRKKYLNPISYFTIALTLSGLLVFIIQKFYPDSIDFTRGAGTTNPEFAEKWSNIVFDFNALFFVMYLPILALPAYLIFNKIRYNLAEYILVFIYVLGHYSICTFPISVGTLLISPSKYVEITGPILLFLFGYGLYVMQKLNRYSVKAFLGRSVVFTALAVVLFFLLILAMLLILLVSGVFELQDFAPPK